MALALHLQKMRPALLTALLLFSPASPASEQEASESMEVQEVQWTVRDWTVHASLVQARTERLHVVPAPESRLEFIPVAGPVAMVGAPLVEGGLATGLEGCQPELLDAQILQAIELLDHSSEVPAVPSLWVIGGHGMR